MRSNVVIMSCHFVTWKCLPREARPKLSSQRAAADLQSLCTACCTGTVIAYRHLDALPAWLQSAVRTYLSQDDRSAASVAETTPLSKHVAYKLDYWCAAPMVCMPIASAVAAPPSEIAGCKRTD